MTAHVIVTGQTGRLTRVTAAREIDDEWSRRAQVGVSNGIAIEGDTASVTQSTTRTVVLEVPSDRPKATTTRELTTPLEIMQATGPLVVQDVLLLAWPPRR